MFLFESSHLHLHKHQTVMKFTVNYTTENTKNLTHYPVAKKIVMGVVLILVVLFYALSFDFLLS